MNLTKYKYFGSCHCKNITLEMELSYELNSYSPRACDCNFCLKHGASYISDNGGKLTIYIEQEDKLIKYRHGDKIADFLLCQICGVLTGVCHENRTGLYATINSRILRKNVELKEVTFVSPKKLSCSEKIKRWQDVWFSNVVYVLK